MMRIAALLLSALLLTLPSLAAEPLRVAIGPEPETLDPHKGTEISAARLLLDLCEGLLTRDADGRTVPGVAERIDHASDGLTMVFHLRNHARWWNGDAVTAADFVRGWRRAIDPATRSGIADLLDGVENAAAIRRGLLSPDRLGIQAADARTLVVRLERPVPDFDMVLAHRLTLPVHGPTLAAHGDGFARAGTLMCNGPYRLTEHRLQDRYILDRAEQWHGAATVKIARVEALVAEKAELEMNLFRAGQVDITSTVPPPMLDWARTNLPDAVQVHPWTLLSLMLANPDGAAWRNNPAFLEALELALDRDQLVADAQGRAMPAYGLIPPGLWGQDRPPTPKVLTGEARRLAARDALARAGYGAGTPPPRVEIVFAGVEAIRRRVIAIAAQWKQVLGVETDLVGLESRMVSTRQRQKDFQGFLYNSWISYSPFYALSPFLPPDAALTATDRAGQAQQIQALERSLLESRRVIPVAFGSAMHLVSPHVGGWRGNTYDIHPLRYLTLER